MARVDHPSPPGVNHQFEDWLQGEPLVATNPDEKRAKWHQYYRTMQVQQIRTLLSNVLPDQFVAQMKESFSEKKPIYRLWAEIEKKYGVSNVTTMKTTTRKLMRLADGDFQSVEAHFGELQALKLTPKPALNASRVSREWALDGGCGHHLTYDSSSFKATKPDTSL
ncbi:hypothetical protein H257_11498 [Aphanomyces astaci]|uniref:Uncharacterized protein n=1 Tax=Aphanomyces astaci TaxID=112090 RepID=W4G4E1_APHAT|nr:hypothetical protein H257_11498 [Aphanomyces astaci]ETV73828.1 hypothetical protein H257_11498 [Aphanomyces astaci]|eukprot:XP_009836764.1 hypothetical protein H257_11498 [Aphanomyces astaci]